MKITFKSIVCLCRTVMETYFSQILGSVQHSWQSFRSDVRLRRNSWKSQFSLLADPYRHSWKSQSSQMSGSVSVEITFQSIVSLCLTFFEIIIQFSIGLCPTFEANKFQSAVWFLLTFVRITSLLYIVLRRTVMEITFQPTIACENHDLVQFLPDSRGNLFQSNVGLCPTWIEITLQSSVGLCPTNPTILNK
jgi:hypothetical protein